MNTKALTVLVKEQIALAAIASACKSVQKRIDEGKPFSPSIGVVHAGIMARALIEACNEFAEYPLDDVRFLVLIELENGSALRARLAKKIPELAGSKAETIGMEY